MKIALIVYHKNIDKIYPVEWIDKFRESILGQTYKDFDIIETDYGQGNQRIFTNSHYSSQYFINFVECMNFMLDKCFADGYDYVFNTNVDDWYSLNRIETQLPWLMNGYDIVTSNFCLVDNDKITVEHKFHNLNIIREFGRGNNIIAHPCVAYSKNFWNYNRYFSKEIPYEDFKLWKRSVRKFRFMIVAENLLFHRLHKNSVCQSANR